MGQNVELTIEPMVLANRNGPHATNAAPRVIDAMDEEGIFYARSRRRFPRSELHEMLRDRSCIGEVRYHEQWHPGQHKPLVERGTFERVQALLGDEKGRGFIANVLRAKAKSGQKAGEERRERTQRQLTQVRRQKDRLLDMRLTEEIDGETFTAKQRQLRGREAKLQALYGESPSTCSPKGSFCKMVGAPGSPRATKIRTLSACGGRGFWGGCKKNGRGARIRTGDLVLPKHAR